MASLTVKQHLETLPRKVREAAIRNTTNYMLAGTQSTASSALNIAFCWRETPEGHDYWRNIHKLLKIHG